MGGGRSRIPAEHGSLCGWSISGLQDHELRQSLYRLNPLGTPKGSFQIITPPLWEHYTVTAEAPSRVPEGLGCEVSIL